jgi:hypothetical protein
LTAGFNCPSAIAHANYSTGWSLKNSTGRRVRRSAVLAIAGNGGVFGGVAAVVSYPECLFAPAPAISDATVALLNISRLVCDWRGTDCNRLYKTLPIPREEQINEHMPSDSDRVHTRLFGVDARSGSHSERCSGSLVCELDGQSI